MKILHKLLGLFLLSVLLSVNGCKQPDVAVVIINNTSGSTSVKLIVENKIKTNSNSSTVVFPKLITATSETIGKMDFIGIIATGGNDKIKILAAALPDKMGFKVIVDSTINVELQGVFQKPNGEIRKSNLNVQAGSRTVILTGVGENDGQNNNRSNEPQENNE